MPPKRGTPRRQPRCKPAEPRAEPELQPEPEPGPGPGPGPEPEPEPELESVQRPQQPEAQTCDESHATAEAMAARIARLRQQKAGQVAPEKDAAEQLNGQVVHVQGTWYGQNGQSVVQEDPMPSPIPVGMIVQLHSLSATKLNGRVGECGAFDERKGRYAVELLDDEGRSSAADQRVNVRPANLCRPRPPPSKELKRAEELAAQGIKMLLAIRARGGTAPPATFLALNKVLLSVLALDPCCYKAHQALGDVCVLRSAGASNHAKLTAAAVRHFRRAAENGGGHVARFALSGVLGRAGDMAGELAELRKILAVDPDNAMCACSMGRLHQYQGRDEEALGELLRVLTSGDR
jgi:hypothetical protein